MSSSMKEINIIQKAKVVKRTVNTLHAREAYENIQEERMRNIQEERFRL